MAYDNKRNALFSKLFGKDKTQEHASASQNEISYDELFEQDDRKEPENGDEYADWFSEMEDVASQEDDVSDTIEELFGEEDEDSLAVPDPDFDIYNTYGEEENESVEDTDDVVESEIPAYAEEPADFRFETDDDDPILLSEENFENEYDIKSEPEIIDDSAFEDDSEVENDLYTYDDEQPEHDEYIEPEEDGEVIDEGSEEELERPVDEDTANLLRALGYDGAGADSIKKSAQRSEPTRTRVSDLSMAFAYEGKEFTSRSQISDIKQAYSRDRKQVMIRFFGTLLFTLLLGIYDAFGKSFGGALDVDIYPVVNILMSLQLLLIAAVFSIKQIYAGLNGIVKSDPIFHSLSATAFVLTVVYDIILAIAAPASFTLYNFPAAICLLLSVGHDYFVLEREIYVFDRLSSWQSVATLERVDSEALSEELGESRVGAVGDKIGESFRLRRGEFAENYFRHINRPHPSAKVINYLVIVPVLALSFVFALLSIASKHTFVEACNTFTVVNLICLPCAMLATMTYPFFTLVSKHFNADSVVFSESDVSEYKKVDTVVFDESDLFDEGSLTINRISVCDKNRMQDVFDIMCSVSAFYERIGGRIAGVFKASTADAEIPTDVRILNVTDGGFEGISGEHRYAVGSDEYLTSMGIPVMRYYDDKYIASNPGGVVLHIAVDGVEVFKLYLTYRIPDSMLGLINELPDSRIRIVMRTVDPNINIDLITRLLANGFNGDLTLVRKPYSEKESTAVVKTPFEGGILVNGENPESIIDVVKACRVYNAFSRLNFNLGIVIYVLGALVSVFLGVIGAIIGFSSMFVFLFQMLSVLPCFILVHLILSK